MDVFEIRRTSLRQVIDTTFHGNVAACARALQMPPSQLHRWLSTTSKSKQNMHELSARDIEQKLGLPAGAMDRSASEADRHPTTETESAGPSISPDLAPDALRRFPRLTPDELKLIENYRKSPPKYRKTITEVAAAGPGMTKDD